MKKISLYAFAGLVLMGAISCTSQEYKKTKSGLLYKIITDKKNPVAKKGEFLKVHFIQKVRDSVLYSSEGGMPVYIQVDSARPVYSPTEIFPLLRKGDSAIVVEMADTLQKRFGGQLPPFIHKKDKLTIAFRVLDVFPTLQDKTKDMEQEMAGEKQREIKAVEDYLAKNNIKAEKTEKGTYVVVNTPGDGPQVDSGKQVSVRYTGKLLPSGKEFESNMKGPGEPYKFVVGQAQIIQGWDDGLRKFKKGGKGTLYIPAFLAYDQSPGPGHKPYENLIFDVEIADVTDAPKQQPMPAMPQMPQQQGRPQQQPHK
ncbi:FKBP-type peptidyl-prolyl cis-trans isomerase [Flavitalea sp. BT771]|uniref:FKBP-type peptidyl-prolyl cis-trans isomerase n=1 Tax=Flavitalea sp. BT771 TaxID=3063329 RepID=UPI0026E207A1|nr:FKBP-type peptidyl-prolyl cis-trans isomerase [Flavitalea sp. BT771]MDO6434520.1 FKBP-type peptidyl-prolyl cis-trans isomerase [Flavitalea sp. BT771]MDV6223420.1 FKBP-type peptidyl-prolyl cis-trans isomerase [Flavitalea sp. BT771]